MTTVFKTDLANYRESIQNIVYCTSRYVDRIQAISPENLKLLEETNFDVDLISFLLIEGEEILRNKMLRMTVDAADILHLKYETIKGKVDELNKSEQFIISRDFINYMYKDLEEIYTFDASDIAVVEPEDAKEFYDFELFMKTEMANLERMADKFCNHEYGHEKVSTFELVREVSLWEAGFDRALVQIKHLMEKTNKRTTATVLFRKMIHYMLMSKAALKTVQKQ